MAKLVFGTCRKSDDLKYEKSPFGANTGDLCDIHKENASRKIMQCPGFQEGREYMCKEVRKVCNTAYDKSRRTSTTKCISYWVNENQRSK